MKVYFRAFAEVDVATIQKRMPFALSTNSTGIVAYDALTAETLALLVAQDWTETCCNVHQVILKTMVLRHGWLEEIAKWLFTDAHRLKVFALVPSNNKQALKLNKKKVNTSLNLYTLLACI